MSDFHALIAQLKQLQAGANQVKAAGNQAMQQAAPGGHGFTVGLRLHRTAMPGQNPARVAEIGKQAMLREFKRQTS